MQIEARLAATRARGQGRHQLPSDAATGRFRHGDPSVQGPVSVRFSRYGGTEGGNGSWKRALVDHIQRFLLEMGSGFAFVGRQVLLEVGDRDFYADLLFYHLKLRRFVVVELKAVPFRSGLCRPDEPVFVCRG